MVVSDAPKEVQQTARDRRKALIAQIEQIRQSKVICYVTGDRQGAASALIGDDAVRPLYDHLRHIGRVPKLDVYLYSRGGAIDVPWRLATAFRQAAEEWNVLIPFRANSAATLLALGADQILLGRQGELGPIDPTLNIGSPNGLQDAVPVEDIMAYVNFVKDRAGLSDQAALATSLTRLADRVDPVVLGSAYRMHSHIRDVAKRMLHSRKDPAPEQILGSIVETLAERVYAHGHAIGETEAKQIGLPVETPPAEIEELMWKLLNEYEAELRLREPFDVAQAIGVQDRYVEESIIAILESNWGCHSFTGQLEATAKRQIPPTLNVSLNLNVQLPPNVDPSTLPVELQQALSDAQRALLEQAQVAVQQALRAQAPLVGVELRIKGGAWRLGA